MKTLEKLLFPKLENEYLENILRQLVNQHLIIQMFFTQKNSDMFSYLIIHVEKNSDAVQLQQNKWVKKVRSRYQIEVLFIYSQRLHCQLSLGHPFFKLYCQPSSLIFQNEEHKNSIPIKQDWKKAKKRFNKFQNNFYHDHDLHKSQIQNLIAEGTSNSIFTLYARLMEYDLEYLEELYCGNRYTLLSLDERINNLIGYIPDIQKYFVKCSHNEYYLTNLFKKAKEATAEDEAFYIQEMYEAVAIAEQSLCRLIEERLENLKKQIKKGRAEKNQEVVPKEDEPNDAILSVAIETIVNLVEVEQIYLFHQTTCHEKTIYYLMLITAGAGNEKLKVITQSLKSKTGVNYDFIVLGHSRKWMQSNLYQNQSFLSNTIKGEYLIYSSSRYHPELHWEVPHNPYHGDLYFYYMAAKDSAFQFSTIVGNAKENYQGLDFIFALFFISFCRTFIYVKTYYLPNYLSSQTLWQLCIYADPDIRKYNYLIEQEQFGTDFFAHIDKHTTLHHQLTRLNHEEVGHRNNIVRKLSFELHDLVIEGGLLNFEED